MTVLTEWQTFYEIVGSSAGALIGLQFVVMALVTSSPAPLPSGEGGEAFATPTIVHFGVVLLLAGIMTAPWHGLRPVAMLWALLGVSGVAYVLRVALSMRKQTAYQPEFEDWLFHAALPLAGYCVILASACLASFAERAALFGIAGSTMALLLIGIHNAWDSAAYHVFVRNKRADR